jgi:hypothetical protein
VKAMKKVYQSRLVLTLFAAFLFGIIARESTSLNVLLLICGPVAALLWVHHDEVKYQKEVK